MRLYQKKFTISSFLNKRYSLFKNYEFYKQPDKYKFSYICNHSFVRDNSIFKPEVCFLLWKRKKFHWTALLSEYVQCGNVPGQL